MLKLITALLASLGGLLGTAGFVLAAPRPPSGTLSPVNRAIQALGRIVGGYQCTTEEISGLVCVLVNLINKLLAAGGLVALLFVLVGGIQYMISGGDEKAITTAKATLTYAVLGLLIILGSILLVNVISGPLLGANF